MFLFRSAFWLAIGFMIVAPHGTDFGATARNVRDGALAASAAAGEGIATMGIRAGLGVAAQYPSLASNLISSPVASPMHDLETLPDAVVPRARPAAMG